MTETSIDFLYRRLTEMTKAFDKSEPDNDYQTGYRAAVIELKKEVILAMGTDRRTHLN